MITPSLQSILIYAKDMQKTAFFYTKYFNFQSNKEVIDELIELNSENGTLQILIHQAAKSLKTGQANIKLVFSVLDLDAFKQQALENGLIFGVTHQANGYQFSNTKDPDGNSISISSRLYR
ncbi:Glyoxalase-like domain protein [compost metagenome]